MENSPSSLSLSLSRSLSLSLLVGFLLSFTCYLQHNIAISLSLSLALLLMPHFSFCYVPCYHYLLPSPPTSNKLKLASLNRGQLLTNPIARRLFQSNLRDVGRLCFMFRVGSLWASETLWGLKFGLLVSFQKERNDTERIKIVSFSDVKKFAIFTSILSSLEI